MKVKLKILTLICILYLPILVMFGCSKQPEKQLLGLTIEYDNYSGERIDYADTSYGNNCPIDFEQVKVFANYDDGTKIDITLNNDCQIEAYFNGSSNSSLYNNLKKSSYIPTVGTYQIMYKYNNKVASIVLKFVKGYKPQLNNLEYKLSGSEKIIYGNNIGDLNLNGATINLVQGVYEADHYKVCYMTEEQYKTYKLIDQTDISALYTFFNGLGDKVVEIQKLGGGVHYCYVKSPETNLYFASYSNPVKVEVLKKSMWPKDGVMPEVFAYNVMDCMKFTHVNGTNTALNLKLKDCKLDELEGYFIGAYGELIDVVFEFVEPEKLVTVSMEDKPIEVKAVPKDDFLKTCYLPFTNDVNTNDPLTVTIDSIYQGTIERITTETIPTTKNYDGNKLHVVNFNVNDITEIQKLGYYEYFTVYRSTDEINYDAVEPENIEFVDGKMYDKSALGSPNDTVTYYYRLVLRDTANYIFKRDRYYNDKVINLEFTINPQVVE